MKHFKQSEFACKHCGENQTSPMLIAMLDQARELAGIPFVITSAYRCQVHNKAVGGVSNSSHTRGLAVDIRCKTGNDRFRIITALLKVGFNRIGIAENFIHCDIDMTLPQNVIFDYK